MKSLALSSIALATLAVAVPTIETKANDKAQGPVVDLGVAGKYLGVLQNNGTVASWKGAPSRAESGLLELTRCPRLFASLAHRLTTSLLSYSLRCPARG